MFCPRAFADLYGLIIDSSDPKHAAIAATEEAGVRIARIGVTGEGVWIPEPQIP